jgi:hypothetical protein
MSSIPSGSSLRKIFVYIRELGWTARIFITVHDPINEAVQQWSNAYSKKENLFPGRTVGALELS